MTNSLHSRVTPDGIELSAEADGPALYFIRATEKRLSWRLYVPAPRAGNLLLIASFLSREGAEYHALSLYAERLARAR